MNSTKNTKKREKAHRRHSFVVLRNRALLLLPLVVIVVLVVYFSAGSLQHAKRRFDSSVYPRTYAAYVEKESAAYHLEPSMVYAVIKQESNFDPKCVSRAGAIGLMQLMPDTFSWLIQNDSSSVASQKTYTDEDLYDPQINIHYGCKYLSILFKTYSDKSTALAAYNAGMGNVSGWLKDKSLSADGKTLSQIPFPETSAYTKLVMQNYAAYKKLYDTDSTRNEISLSSVSDSSKK